MFIQLKVFFYFDYLRIHDILNRQKSNSIVCVISLKFGLFTAVIIFP